MTDNPFSETDPFRSHRHDLVGSIRRRVLASLAGCVGWISLTLLFLAFWSHGFTMFQDIVVLVVSLLVLAGVLLGAWITFGLRFVGRWPD